MSNEPEFDVIVIGAGISGGIPAAAYLQKAGARVLLIDANDAPAVNCRTYTWQGASCTPCAGGYAGGTAPMWADLELEKHGAELLVNPRYFAMLFDDDTSLCLGPFDPEGTYRDIAQYSQKDADTFKLMSERIQETFMELADLIYFQPPSGERLDRIMEQLAYVADVPVEDFIRMDVWEFLDYRFEDHRIKQLLLMPFASSMVNSDPDRRGEGAAGVLTPFYLIAGQVKNGNQRVVDAVLKVFEEFGGEMWLESPVARIVVENGRAVGVELEPGAKQRPGEIIRAKHAVLSNTGAVQTYKLLGDEIIRAADDKLATKMKCWDMQSRPSTANVWLLKDAPKWKAAEKDPYLEHADWVYVGLSSAEAWRDWKNAIVSGDQAGGFQGWWEIFLPALIDPSQRGDNGEVCFRVESVAPYNLVNDKGEFDDSLWDTYKWELIERRTEVFERYAPGFKELLIDVVHARSPRDLWNDNRALAYGCAQGGAFTGDQSYMGRMPYRMPIDNLYMCNSVWPGNLTWCGSGHIAAGIIAEEMRIREQDWWKSKPGEWFMANAERLMKTGAAWQQVA